MDLGFNKILSAVIKEKEITSRWIQLTFNFGYNKADKVLQKLIEKNYIVFDRLDIYKVKKITTYCIIISEFFPKTHSRAGEPTNFPELISQKSKIHTIRGNYEFWNKRFEKIKRGEAVLSVRGWTDKPYFSNQKEFFLFTNDDQIGIEPWHLENNSLEELEQVAKNDGLNLQDFREWFKNTGPEKKAIIHFTKFRYGNK